MARRNGFALGLGIFPEFDPFPHEVLWRAGNSPVQIHKSQLAEVVPIWYDLALRMKRDPAAQAAFGWIQEVNFIDSRAHSRIRKP